MNKKDKTCPHCQANMREQWIKLHLEKRMPITEIAKLSGHHQDTLYIWKSNYLKYGRDGLIPKSRAPHNHPNEYADEIKSKIKLLRKQGRGICADVIKVRLKKRHNIEASRSGIAGFLKREGLVNPKLSRRIKNKKKRIKKCKIHEPGQLIQFDVKYAFKSFADYWFYQYSSIDYLTGIAYGMIYEIQSNLEGILFTNSLLNFYPFRIKGIQTDNHSTFTNRYTGYEKSADPLNPRLHPFDLNCQRLDIEHYLTDKGKPAQNGKVERFHRTCEQEFYQREIFKDLNSARKKFRDFLHYYNNNREHLGLNGLTPLEKLRTIAGFEKVKSLNP
ncbi:MAG: integrase core domain-containing protein [Candidatus Portnoybacteria bacterium]